MRCLLFTDTINDVNGVARFVQTLAGWACATGRNFRVLSSSAKSRSMDFPDQECIDIVPPSARMSLPGYSDLDIALPRYGELLKRAAEFRPDVVHVSTPGPVGICGKMIARRLGVPLVGTWHTDFASYVRHISHVANGASLGEMSTELLYLFYRDFDLILARSPVSLPDIRATGVKRYRAFAPGVDLRKFSPVWKDRAIWGRWGLDPQRRKVVYVGRVSREKGVMLLERIAENVRSRCVDADLVVVGSGPMQMKMQERLPEATFTGFVHGETLARVYASSDVIVFPSETDTLGQVVLEAQASGIGVLVTDQGGPQYLVKNGETGWVIPAAEPGRWGGCIETMLKSTDLIGIGQRARRHMQNYDINDSCESFWGEHENLLNQLRARRE